MTLLAQALDDVWAVTPDPRRDRLAAAFVTHLVALATDVPPHDIVALKRSSAPAARARQMAIYLAHVSFHWPLARVAFAFNRDRTTCGHACHRIEDLRDDPAFDARLRGLETCLSHMPARVLELAR